MALDENAIFKQSQSAHRHWSLLGDPAALSPAQRESGKTLRASMTEWDWAKEQVCLSARVGPRSDWSGPGISIRMAKSMWALPIFRGHLRNSPVWYCRHKTAKLFKELVDAGFLEPASSETVKAYQLETKRYPLRRQSCYLYSKDD